MFKILKNIFLICIIIIIILLVIREVFFEGPANPPTDLPLSSMTDVYIAGLGATPPLDLPTSPIIDMHVHIAGLGFGDSGCFISEEMKSSFKFDFYLGAFGVSRKELEAEGDQLLVKRLAATIEKSEKVQGAIVLAMDGVMNSMGELDIDKTQVYIPNRYVLEQTSQHPSLYFGASINPYRKDSLALLDQVKRQGAKLIKWIPNIQHIDPSDKIIIPFYQKMKALGLPLLSHTGQERSFHSAIDEYADPKRLELPLSLGVTVIAAHIATTGDSEEESNFQRILPMFPKFPNLYADISSLTQINKLGFLTNALKEPRLKGRLLYGSDYPLVNMVLVSPYYFPLNLTLKQMYEIANIDNPWDRDVALKQALGVPTQVFSNSAKLLNVF